jgi:hypothetical protein
MFWQHFTDSSAEGVFFFALKNLFLLARNREEEIEKRKEERGSRKIRMNTSKHEYFKK